MPKNSLFQKDIAQLAPKGYCQEKHEVIIQLIEDKKPAAIIAATDLKPCTTAALLPVPLFEDAALNQNYEEIINVNFLVTDLNYSKSFQVR